jgi:hypothetical protein
MHTKFYLKVRDHLGDPGVARVRKDIMKIDVNSSSMEVKNTLLPPRIRFRMWAFVGRFEYPGITK